MIGFGVDVCIQKAGTDDTKARQKADVSIKGERERTGTGTVLPRNACHDEIANTRSEDIVMQHRAILVAEGVDIPQRRTTR